MVTETIAGTGNFGKHLSQIGRGVSPLYQKCKMANVDTRRHLIEECLARIGH